MLVDVLLPLAIADVYTYSVPTTLACPLPGTRVMVPLGKKSLTGIVRGMHEGELSPNIRVRDIEAVLDEQPVVSPTQLQLWSWMAEYYLCTPGEVMAAALPSGIIDDDYRAKTTSYITLHQGVLPDEALQGLSRAHKQQLLLQAFLTLSNNAQQPIERRLLIEQSGQSPAILRSLIEREILDEVKQPTRRILPYEGPVEPLHDLNEAQRQAYRSIHDIWQQKDIVLLHGVTSSGKTEVYMHLIQDILSEGKDVLYLVPEIALTTQLTDRLQLVFGDRVMVYHSRFSDAERVETYLSILQPDSRGRLLVGARSAIFLPPERIGLIIVDEEHETSYKQQDPAPRYHARSAAIMLARYLHAKVLLGTATPAIETYHNALTGKYGLVSLTERYAGLQLPQIHIIDLQRQYHRKEMYEHFSDPLVDRIRQQLEAGKQVIIFQNRRGYAPYMQCTSCSTTPRCVQCDVALTLHLRTRQLTCHYCGYTIPQPTRCPQCGGEMRIHGFGTERIEEEVSRLFPNARVARMDLDTTRTKTAYQDIINDFSAHRVDILIGTQMVSKGVHFDDVSLVAVLNTDSMLHLPDFRSMERAYQMLEQVAGRAGRKGAQGEVILQTFDPQNGLFTTLRQHDYQKMYHTEIAEREMFHFPPYHRLINITLKHRDDHHLQAAAITLQQQLHQVFGERCSQIIVPGITRVNNQYVRLIRLRIEADASMLRAIQMTREQIRLATTLPTCRGVIIVPDVDPL